MNKGNQDVWLLDGVRASRITFDSADDGFPMWSPDGTRIVFRTTRTGAGDLYQTLAAGGGVDEPLVVSGQFKVAASWSPDGRFLLYQSTDSQTASDLWVVPVTGNRQATGSKPTVFLKTPFVERYGMFSPDGRWVAYQSNESGRNEIYVRAFVPPSREASANTSAPARVAAADQPPDVRSIGGQWQVSTAGGTFPVWRHDGKELYYLSPAGDMMAAPIASAGSAIAPGTPTLLFQTRIFGGGEDVQQGRQYDVTRDGRFLINTELERAAAPITLLMNWNPDAKQ